MISDTPICYDPFTGFNLIYGGDNSFVKKTFHYELSTDVATDLSPSPQPTAVAHHRMVHSPTLGGIVLFGGSSVSTTLDETWFWDGTWHHITTADSPPPRNYCPLAIDGFTGNVILFGGIQGGTILNDTWSFDGINWTELFPSTVPGERFGQYLTQAGLTGAIMQGGQYVNAGLNDQRNDVWFWDGRLLDWSQDFGGTPGYYERGWMTYMPPTYNKAVWFGGYSKHFAGSPSVKQETWLVEGWPEPVIRPDPATVAGLPAVWHNGQWHIMPAKAI